MSSSSDGKDDLARYAFETVHKYDTGAASKHRLPNESPIRKIEQVSAPLEHSEHISH